MSKRFIDFNTLFFFAPPDGKAGAVEDKQMSKEDTIEFLASDDEDESIEIEDSGKKAKSSTKDEKKDEEKADEEESDKGDKGTDKQEDEDEEDEEDEGEKELKDIEEELEGPTEEQLELVTPVRRREILKVYPDLFKKFPYLEKAYYREQQYTELLPTIDDAKQAVSAKETLDRLEVDLVKGNIETLLKSIKGTSPKSFNRIADDYLTALGRVDERAYHHVISNILKHTIAGAANTKQEKLRDAANEFYKWLFPGDTDYVPPGKLVENDEDDEKETKLTEREREFVRQRFETTRDDLNSRVNNSLRKTIETNIDPKESMTDYVRRNASRDALDSLDELIEKDTRFKTFVDRLWEKAFDDNFSRTSIDRIKTAYFSKAKTLLPSVIKKARNEALKGMGKRVRNDSNDDNEKESSKGPISPGRPRSTTSGKITRPEDIPKGMKTLDFLNMD